MTKSNIEITDSAYLITLVKSEFDYLQIKQLLNILVTGHLPGDGAHHGCGETADKRPHEMAERFDSLADK